MDYREEADNYILIVPRGISLARAIARFCMQEGIVHAPIYGFGFSSHAHIGHFDEKSGEYTHALYSADREVLGLRGTVSRVDEVPFVHAHLVLADGDRSTIQGYFKDIVVGHSFELHIGKKGIFSEEHPITLSLD